jgi:RNase P/RNase MRP subunit p30
MNFYCDLCLNNKGEASNANFNELISCSILDNFQIISINQTQKALILDEKKQKLNTNIYNINKDLLQDLYKKNSIKFLNVQKSDLINWDKIKILTRLTLEVSDQKDIFQITKSNDILKKFDIVAIKPKNDKILENILMSEINCDIITIDLYEKFSFMSKKKLFQTSADKGMFFEVEYGKFITDNESRSNYISNFILLNNVLKGKNLIISSGAENLFMQRNPEDVMTILETIFDIKKDQAFKMITENPIKAILKGKQRKLYKTTLDIIKNDNK